MQPPQPTRSRMLGKYQIVREIGRGAFGIVFLARDTSMANRSVAIKMLHRNLVNDRTFVANFVREAQIAMRLSDENIVHVYDVGHAEGGIFVVMQYVEGESLAQRLLRGPLPFDRAVEITTSIGSALDAAHRIGFLHGDVKPSNILLDNRRNAYLSDFGLARARGALGIVSSNGLPGTAAYIAPEQAKEEPIDGRADVYSLATTAYEMFTGRTPFTSETLFGYINKIATSQPPAPARYNDRISQSVQEVLLKGLAKNPADRYASALAFAQALQKASVEPFRSALTDEAVLHSDDALAPEAERTGRPFLALFLIVLLAVVLGVAGLAVSNNASNRRGAATLQAVTVAFVAAADTEQAAASETSMPTSEPTSTPTVAPTVTVTALPPTATVTATPTAPPTATATPPPATPSEAFGDDFNSGLSDQWEVESGSIGVLLQRMRLLEVVPEEHTEGLATLPGASWTDLALEATLRDLAGGDAESFLAQGDAAVGFLIRMQADGSGVALLVERDALQFAWRDDAGKWQLVVGSRVTEGVLIDQDTPIRLQARGELLTAFIGDEEVTRASVPIPAHGTAGIWLRSGARRTRDSRLGTPKIDNFSLTPIKPAIVEGIAGSATEFADEFESGLASQWRRTSDNWGMARGKLTLTALEPDRATISTLLTDRDWGDVAIEVAVADLFELSASTFLFEGNSAVAVLTRVQPNGSAVGLVIERRSLAFATLDSDGTWTLLDGSRVLDAFDPQAEPAAVIRVEAVAGLYTAFVDDVPVSSAAFAGPISGRVGVWMRSAIPVNPAAPDVTPKVEFVRITVLP